MMFVRHRINFPMALFSISEQQLRNHKLGYNSHSDAYCDPHLLHDTAVGQWEDKARRRDIEHSMQVQTPASDDCTTSGTIAHPHHTATSHSIAVSSLDDPRISRLAPSPHHSHSPTPRHRVLSSFGICRITAWLAFLQTTSAFILITYCWGTPDSSIIHPYFGAAVMLAVLTLHLLFLFWPFKMEASARSSLRRSLRRCFLSGWVKYRLLDNVSRPAPPSFPAHTA
jgi:hypothetical protein